MDVRSYDPAIARFTSIDPVTHHSMSTYMAFDGNPVYWADPSGADAEHEAWVAQNEADFAAFNNTNSSGWTNNSGPTDWIYKNGKYVWDEDVTEENDSDLPEDAEYVGVSKSDVEKHWKEKRPWYLILADADIDTQSFTNYLERQLNLKISSFFNDKKAQRIDDIRGLYENLSFGMNYGRLPTFKLNFDFNGQTITSGEFETKLFKDKYVNIISYPRWKERKNPDGSIWSGKYPYRITLFSSRLSGYNIQPAITIFMSSESDYFNIKNNE